MRLKRYVKTVLSAVVAAAMLVTAVPQSNVLAAQSVSAETEADESLLTELSSEQSTQTAETTETQTTETTETSETQTDEEQTSDSEKNTTDDSDNKESEDENSRQPINDGEGETVDLTTGYHGPTIDYDPNSATAGAVTVYYYSQNFDSEVTSVKVKGSWVSDWSDLIAMDAVTETTGMFSYTFPLDKMGLGQSYEYGFTPNADSNWDIDDCNPTDGGNSKILRNPVKDASGNVTLYYYPSHGDYPTDVKVKYRTAGSSDTYTEAAMSIDSVYTKIYSATLTGLTDGTYEYVFDVDGTEVQDTNNPETGKFTIVSYPAKDDSVVSPVVNGRKVSFHYYGPTNSSAQVAGSMEGWNGIDMTYDSATAYWNLEMELGAGVYQYKFIVDGSWITDELNTADQIDGNSVVTVPGLEDKAQDAKAGADTSLPATLKVYSEDGTTAETAVTYSKSSETAAAEWTDKITLAETEGATTLTIAEDFPADEVTEFTLQAADASGNTSVFTVHVVSQVYKYTIYYYDADHGTDAALWLWQTSGAGASEPTYFSGEEVLADGNTWLKAEVEIGYTDLSIIPRAYADWAWQDSDRTFVNTDEAEEVTLYIVYEDGTNIYTELPEIKVAEKRYLVVEYTRNDGSAKDWYFYTWNSGYGSNVFVPFEETDGKWIAKVPVKQGLDSISYCIERAENGEHWAEKDGNDYKCAFPTDQTVVKIRMEEGKGITYTYPYNIGYELQPQEGRIQFYYRNDEEFAAGSESGLASVAIEIDGTEYPMTFDKEEQRYTYSLEDLKSGSYKYRYVLKETANAEKTYELDRFNEEKTTEDGVEYSVCKYESFDAVVEASVWNSSMDYNDNNVISVSFIGKDGAEIAGMEASSISVDLTELGGGVTEMETEIMELSIAVKEGTAAGEKVIPITVFDQYNNEYTAQVTVTVTERSKGADFDWDEAVIYFAVTDRFFDGNSSNNGAGYDTSENGSSSYHGGDFAGLTQKLDYLKELGVNTIWITPIAANDMADGLATDVEGIKSWGYHGYWASDFTKLDSHLGTEEEFKALLDAAHARGMKLMVDVVLNHSGYNQEEYFNNILKDENGNPIQMIRDASQMVNGSDQQTSLSGLPDFLTENAEVRELLVEWQSGWISKYDIDYYRVDTVKHVDDATWSAFKNALTKIDPDFKMIGEWAGAGYATDTGMLRTGRMDSLLDFDFNGQALDFATGKIAETESFLNSRNAAIDNTATLGAFLGSHDEDGFIYSLKNEKKVDAEKARKLAKVAAALQITAKGQVVIYYGEEIGMTGANNYPYQTNRYDFDWTQANDENDMLVHYKKLLAIRNRYSEVLAKGTRTTLEASNEKGLDVFARTLGDTTLTVGLNISDKETEYTFSGLKAETMYTDQYSGKRYVTDAEGKTTVLIPAAADGGTVVLAEGEAEDKFVVNAIADQTYTGNAIKLSEAQLKVYYGVNELKAGTDYTVKYSNNKAVGTAKVTITGKGNYTGKETVTFNIVPKSVADADIIIEYKDNLIATGKAQKALEKVTYNGKKLSSKDYIVSYYKLGEDGKTEPEAEPLNSIKEAGKYELSISGQGNFTDGVRRVVTINETGTYVSKLKITLDKTSAEYTGSEIEMGVTVSEKTGAKKELTGCKAGETNADAEYTVSYTNNVNVGTATVTVTGVPEKGYYGSVTKTFKITGKKLASVAKVDETNWKASVAYDVHTGAAVQDVNEDGTNKVGLVLKTAGDDGKLVSLTEGKDYTVSYTKNDKPGTATMVFTGKGLYTGTIKKTFKVTKLTLSTEAKEVSYTVAAEAPYTKKGAKAAVTVSYDGVALTEGRDYKLTYKNNTALTTETTADNKKAQVKITGMGAFTGSILNTDSTDAVTDTTFKVVEADLSAMNMTAADVVFQNKKGKFMSAPVLTDETGSKLKNKKDYNLTYYLVNGDGTETEKTKDDIVELVKSTVDGEEISSPATIRVEAVAAEGSNYKANSKISTTYRVVKSNISGAKVTVNAKVYTGKAITLDENDFTKIKVGNVSLEMGKDYEIVAGSYINNVKKGTASVTIKGIGNYGGTKKVTYKITSRTVAWWWNLVH